MLVPVVQKDGQEELVSKDALQLLFSREKIPLFKRSDGWVVPGRDHMRRLKVPYSRAEQRKIMYFHRACAGLTNAVQSVLC